MASPEPEEVTLTTLHEDLKVGFADLKTTLITGFRSLPTRETSEEMVRLLRENNRIQEERFTQLELRIREQHFEIQQILRALAEGQRILTEGQRGLQESQRTIHEDIRALHEDIQALIARLDAIIKGRGDGAPTS